MLKTQLKNSVINSNAEFLGSLPIYVNPEGQCRTFNIGNTTKTLVYPNGEQEQVSGDIIAKLTSIGTLQKFQLLNSKYSSVNMFIPNSVMISSPILPLSHHKLAL